MQQKYSIEINIIAFSAFNNTIWLFLEIIFQSLFSHWGKQTHFRAFVRHRHMEKWRPNFFCQSDVERPLFAKHQPSNLIWKFSKKNWEQTHSLGTRMLENNLNPFFLKHISSVDYRCARGAGRLFQACAATWFANVSIICLRKVNENSAVKQEDRQWAKNDFVYE